MDILFVSDLYPIFENEKGVPSALCDFVQSWIKLGHNVCVFRPNLVLNTLVRKRKIYPTGEYEFKGVRVFNKNYFLPSFNPPIEVFQNHFDVVIAHMPSGILAGKKIAKKLSLPFVCAVHSSDIAVLKRYPYFSGLLKNAYRKCTSIAARSPWLKDEIIKILPEVSNKVFIAPSGVDEDIVVKPKANPETKRFLVVAQLVRRKNFSNLIKAFSRIKNEYVLDIIGVGPEEKTLKCLCKKLNVQRKINFLGALPHSVVLEKMRNADAFVLPSKDETFGLVYLEAMASGCMTLCAAHSGVAGIIEDGMNGFLCGVDVDSIFEKLQQIILYKNKEQLLEAGYQTVLNFGKEKVAQNYLCNIINLGNLPDMEK